MKVVTGAHIEGITAVPISDQPEHSSQYQRTDCIQSDDEASEASEHVELVDPQ